MALAAGRSDVIHLEVGEPDFSTPTHIIDAAFAAARSGWTKYSSNAGLPALRQQVAERANISGAQPLTANDVVITTGAIGALYSSLMAVIDPGDEVLIPDPGWPNYEAIVHLAGGIAVRYMQPASRNFLPDPAEIAHLITPLTKALLINTPGNPSGVVFPASLIAELGDIVRGTGIYLVSDEIYEDIVFESKHVSVAVHAPRDRVFIVSGFSKTYAMTGWRLGWLICPPGLSSVVAGLQEPVTSCASTIAQKAGEAALAGDQASVSAMREIFKRRRDVVVDVFGNTGLLPATPEGAFYALIDINSTGRGSLEFAKGLLIAHNTAVVPGITFGPSCDRYVRIAFTTSDDALREGLQRLRAHIEMLARKH
ncbi:MAG TPA: pyridoxal phosphate-dependent aminotransferase [Candidatus Binataceae bacterium]